MTLVIRANFGDKLVRIAVEIFQVSHYWEQDRKLQSLHSLEERNKRNKNMKHSVRKQFRV